MRLQVVLVPVVMMVPMKRVLVTAAFVLDKTHPRSRTVGVSFSELRKSRSKLLPPSAMTHNALDSSGKDSQTRRTPPRRRKTHKITWKTPDADEDVVFHAMDGETLRTACLRWGKVVSPHNGHARLVNCRGLGTCGTCAVELGGSAVAPPERNAIEQARLNLPPHSKHNKHNSKLRLACQVRLQGDLTVTKRMGFWGQGDGIAPIGEATTYSW